MPSPCSSVPVQASGLSGVVAIGAGHDHSIALKADGTVWAWGRNAQGQLGDGTTVDHTTPAPVANLSGVTAIAAAQPHNLALRTRKRITSRFCAVGRR
jgi:alpha-tubulin suppressor-like RCC1 family protein